MRCCSSPKRSTRCTGFCRHTRGRGPANAGQLPKVRAATGGRAAGPPALAWRAPSNRSSTPRAAVARTFESQLDCARTPGVMAAQPAELRPDGRGRRRGRRPAAKRTWRGLALRGSSCDWMVAATARARVELPSGGRGDCASEGRAAIGWLRRLPTEVEFVLRPPVSALARGCRRPRAPRRSRRTRALRRCSR